MPYRLQTTLAANLLALRAINGDAASIVEAAPEHPEFRPVACEDGLGTGELIDAAGARALSSRRRPGDEAARLAASVDLTKAAIVVVLGFAAGHHVRELARRVAGTGLVIVFEPDVALLRSVLSHIDHSAWLGSSNIRVLTSADDRAAMIESLQGCEGLVGMGVKIVEHAPSSSRLGPSGRTFAQRLTEVVESVKMNVLTSMVQVRTTVRNSAQNLDRYVLADGVASIQRRCAGHAGIVVAAGPSLTRNVDQLAEPGVRDRFVIVAVQTVIKTLLERGIRPHFVTALDHSEISRRFYEGLSERDVAGITLVVEPKVNPAVLDAWPGAVRMVADTTLDRLLGDLAPQNGSLTAGATVAHLAYYLCRHLGCDPVALIGQDLGFTDGQYYAPGAAIHNVWAGELNSFNTIEMLEWQRVLRMGEHLRRATDILGRPIYTDEQMQAYLSQFERDFRRDKHAGLTTIDATEGGVRKQHTEIATLSEFLRANWDRAPRPLNIPEPCAKSRSLLKRADARVRDVRRGVWRLGELCRSAESLLNELIAHHDDQPRVNRLIGRLDVVTAEALSQQPAYAMTHTLAQTGAFNRVRSDRLIHLDESLDAMARQQRQARRDLDNVRTLGDTAQQLGTMLDQSLATMNGGERVTREVSVTAPSDRDRIGLQEGLCVLLSAVDALRGRGVLSPLAADSRGTPLGRTIERVLRCQRVTRVLVVTDQPDAALDIARKSSDVSRVRIVPVVPTARQRFRSKQVWAARAGALACWRGGIASASCFDEAFDPEITLDVMNQHGLDAAAIVGGTWELLDPTLTDQVIQRLCEDTDGLRITFAQSVPGLSPCAISRSLVAQLAQAAHASVAASIGTLLGYNPLAPVNDLIASTRCVPVSTALRDLGVRAIPDTDAAQTAIRFAATREDALDALASINHGNCERVVRADSRASLLTSQTLSQGSHLTLIGIDDVPDPEACLRVFVSAAGASGFHLHVRTRLGSDAVANALCAAGIDIVSIDLAANSPEVYERMTGRTDFDDVLRRTHHVIAHRASVDQPSGPLLVVPRITRCDTTYSEIEPFYSRWMMASHWVVIDPLPSPRPGDRIAPLPIPPSAARRLHAGAHLSVEECAHA